MKIKVTKQFLNKLNRKELFEVGQEIEVDDARGADIVKRGLGVGIKVAKEPDVSPIFEGVELKALRSALKDIGVEGVANNCNQEKANELVASLSSEKLDELKSKLSIQ